MAILFSDSNYIATSPSWAAFIPVTISVWFKINTFNTVSGANRLVGCDDNWEVRCTSDWGGQWKFSNEIYGSTVTQPPCQTTTIIQTGVWYHGVGTATGTVGAVTAQIFLNGILENTLVQADTAPETSLSIGNRDSSPAGQSTNGVIDDVRIYTRVLSANEVATIYACKGTDSIYYGLKDRWLLDEGSLGTTITGTNVIRDMVGTQHGSPIGSPAPTWNETFLKKRPRFNF
jgi:hypothetical protein